MASGTRKTAPSRMRPKTTVAGGMCSTATRMNRNELPQCTEVTAQSSPAFRLTVLAPQQLATGRLSTPESGPYPGLDTAAEDLAVGLTVTRAGLSGSGGRAAWGRWAGWFRPVLRRAAPLMTSTAVSGRDAYRSALDSHRLTPERPAGGSG